MPDDPDPIAEWFGIVPPHLLRSRLAACGGIAVRVAQRLLAMTATIWHNHKIGQPTTRSLIAYDH